MCKQSQINRDKIIKIFYLYFKINLQNKKYLETPKSPLFTHEKRFEEKI